MYQLIFAYTPIVLLIYLMTKKNSMPSFKALPLVALVTYLLMLVVFRRDAVLIHANVLKGFLVSWTPILIIAGAVFLFRTMEATGALNIIRAWLNGISKNKIAQLMIVGWAFPFLIEGASGFGTPAALAAPILAGLGFPPVRVAILALIMNSVPVSFGAVGTPTWIGFSSIELTHREIMLIGIKSAITNGIAALIIPAIALSFIVKPKSILKNAPFVLLSVLVTVVPYILIARVNYEFPSLIGGFVGLVLTVVLAKKGIGLSNHPVEVQEAVGKSKLMHEGSLHEVSIDAKSMLKASFPLWGTILILVLTRIPQLGIKSLLVLQEPSFDTALGALGDFSLSPALVLSLKNIFGTGVEWTHSVLYVPSLIPFLLISYITFIWFGAGKQVRKTVISETLEQMHKPAIALFGALIFVNLMMMGGNNSAVTLIGESLAEVTGNTWKYFSAYLGAIGSFFSGSNTISNLTFGGIQDSIALNLGLNRTTILALQSVGGAMGAMVSINNIVAVASVLALGDKEGYILKRTAVAMFVYGLVAATVAAFM